MFGNDPYSLINKIFEVYSASEVFDRIKAYEQERNNQFHIGDEFENESGDRFVILSMDGEEIDRYMDELGKTYAMYHKYKVIRKTGRHFNEVEKLFRKMNWGR